MSVDILKNLNDIFFPDLAMIFIKLFGSRFVLNVPKEDLQSFERILFLVEYAHWYYEDNSVEMNPSLKSLTLKEFTSLRILCNAYRSL